MIASYFPILLHICFLISLTEEAQILQRRAGEVYVHYIHADKRMDEWIPDGHFRPSDERGDINSRSPTRKRKRKGDTPGVSRPGTQSPAREQSAGISGVLEGNGSIGTEEIVMTEEDFDIQHHKQITAQRNFDKVHFGEWQIKTWCARSENMCSCSC